MTTESLRTASSEDKDTLILVLQDALEASQRALGDTRNRCAVLEASNADMHEQIEKWKETERGKREEIQLLQADLEVTRSLLQMQYEQQARESRESPQRQPETISTRHPSDSAASDALTSPNSADSSMTPNPVPAPDTARIQELESRLLAKDDEIQCAKGMVESLKAEVRMLKIVTESPLTQSGVSVDTREFVKMRERVKMVEEALRAMRDEAREHVLSIKSSDLEFQSLLGTGSFAEVHQAVWKLSCAVKRLNPSVRSNNYEVRKFQKEAHLLRSLLHPGILRVFGFCKTDFILVSEVIPGGSLHELIHQSPPVVMSVASVLDYSAQVCN